MAPTLYFFESGWAFHSLFRSGTLWPKIFFQVLAPNVSSWAPARLHAFSCNCTLVCRMHFMSCSLILWSSALLPFRPQCTWVTIATKEAMWDFTLYRGYHFLILGADSQHMFLHVLFCGALLFILSSTSYCLAIWASQTKSDSIANLLNSSRKALPAKGAPHSSRSLRQHSLEPSPCVHLLVCQMSSALWTSGQAGLWSFFFWESWGFSSFVLAYGPSRQTCPSTSLSWPWGLQVVLQQPTTSPTKNFILSGHLGKSD